jgi:hypothetical protein
VAAGAAVAVAVAAASVAGGVACENEVKENVSMKAKLKTIFLEIELWLPTFFILYNDYRLMLAWFFLNLFSAKAPCFIKNLHKNTTYELFSKP